MWIAAPTCVRHRPVLAFVLFTVLFTTVPLTHAAGGVDRRAPSSPANLRMTAVTSSSVSLAWDPAKDNKGGTQLAGYGVYRNAVLVRTTTNLNYTFTSLSCGTTSTFGVDAFDTSGNRSPAVTITASTSPCALTVSADTSPPSTPTALAVKGTTATTISLSWSASTDNVGIAGYGLYRNGSSVGTTSQTTYSFGGLSCGSSFTLGVDAYDAAGNRSSIAKLTASTSACDTTRPTAPTNLTKTGATQTSISISWSASSDNVGVVGYGLYRGGTLVGSSPTTQATFGSLSCGSTYTLGVDAVDAAGNRSTVATLGAATSACSTTQSTPQPLGASGSWNLLFDDEMNGTSVDLSKWRPNWLGSSDTAITKPIDSSEQSCYDPAQVTEGGGNLTLTAVKRLCTAQNGVTYQYASGMIESDGKFNFTYGFMEAHMWLPNGGGSLVDWPAFWASGSNWPADGEIDVMEVLGGQLCWHFHYSGGAPGSCPSVPEIGGWHTFGADWEPGVITFYYDGVRVGQITSGVTSAPMKLCVNFGLSSNIVVPANTLVDYVRVWHKAA
jgi:chitodextrinase